MADILDQADMQMEYAIKNALNTRLPEPSKKHTGFCWYCENEVEASKRWCSPECRDAWEKENQ